MTIEDDISEYGCLSDWEDERLIQTYRRLSRDLRQKGFDTETIHRMGCIEDELRIRQFNPDQIADQVDDEFR